MEIMRQKLVYVFIILIVYRENREKQNNEKQNKGEVWAIVNKDNLKVIGSIGLHKDRKRDTDNAKMIGYVLSQDYWGYGLVPEAVMELMQCAFEELNLNIISIYHFPFNEQSKRVIEKCGFKYEGTIRMASEIYNGSVYDEVCYSITKDEWLAEMKVFH